MDSLLTKQQFACIMGEESEDDEPIDSLSWQQIEEMLENFQSELDGDYEVRLPSEAEWLRCKEHLDLNLPVACKKFSGIIHTITTVVRIAMGGHVLMIELTT